MVPLSVREKRRQAPPEQRGRLPRLLFDALETGSLLLTYTLHVAQVGGQIGAPVDGQEGEG